MNSLRNYISLPNPSQQTWLKHTAQGKKSSGQSFMGFMSQNCSPRVIRLYSVCFRFNSWGRKRYKWPRETQWKHYMKSTPSIAEPPNTHRPGRRRCSAGTDWICGSRYEKNRSLCKLCSVWLVSMATGPPILTQNARYAFGSEDSCSVQVWLINTGTQT